MLLRTYESYDEYSKIQSEWSVRKKHYVWAQEDVLNALAEKIESTKTQNPFIICHGVRNGFEVKFLKKRLANLNPKIIGTEISEVSKECELTIQWDFHKIKDEWIENVDFIYSNSFDHSYDPHQCLANWMKCISKNGICFLEWTNCSNAGKTSDADCFQASLDEYIKLADGFQVEVIVVEGRRNLINATKQTRLIMISHKGGAV